MHAAHNGVNALFQRGCAFTVQNGQNRRAKRAEGALAWKLVIEQEMSQFVRQRESLFFVGIARVNKDYAFPPVGQQASMQAAILPTDAMSNLDAPLPGQNKSATPGRTP